MPRYNTRSTLKRARDENTAAPAKKKRTSVIHKNLTSTNTDGTECIEPTFNWQAALEELPDESRFQVAMLQEMLLSKVVKSMVDNQKYRVYPEGTEITDNTLKNYRKRYNADDKNKFVSQAVSDMPVSYVSEVRDRTKDINYVYSHTLDVDPRATNQAHSGRCWLFSGLNAMRISLIQRFNLRDTFQLSQAHLFFYDKLERCNHLLEELISLRESDTRDPVLYGLLTWFSPISDGGTWTFFCNLVRKYGVMPKSNFDECVNTFYTDEMNEVLQHKISQFAADMHSKFESGWTEDQLRRYKDQKLMPQVYNLLRNFMGEPPSKFDWSYYETYDHNARHEAKVAHNVRDLTPLDFFKRFVDPVFNMESKVCLVHDPRRESQAYGTYIPQHFANVVGGQPNRYINVPMSEMKHAAKESIKNKEPCWIACDVGKYFAHEKQLLDDKAFNYGASLNTDMTLSKEDRIRYYDSTPSHAMLLVGVDLKKDVPQKWRIENSWGAWEDMSEETDPGYLQMSDSWFSEYMYEVVVDREFLSNEARENIERFESSPKELPFNDPFGAVALLKPFKPFKSPQLRPTKSMRHTKVFRN